MFKTVCEKLCFKMLPAHILTCLDTRSLSEHQESAQYLAGEDFPQAILQSLLCKAALPAKSIGLVNLTPYDLHWERMCLS